MVSPKPLPQALCLVPIVERDITEVIALQREVMPASIVTQLGSGFLHGFYRAALRHPSCVSAIARTAQGAVAGFMLATKDAQRFDRDVGRAVALRLLLALANPRRIALFPRFAAKVFETGPQASIPGELLLLAVAPEQRRQRLASALLQHMEESFHSTHLRLYRVAVRTSLTDARAFYRALGFQHEGDFTVLGEPMTYLTRQIR